MKRRVNYRKSRRSRKTRYRKPRWMNRASSQRKGRLPPSIRSKIDSHFREKKFIESILPITRWYVETAKFDIQKITNSDVSGSGYQNGAQKGFYNTKAYVLHRDKYKCQKCKAKDIKLQIHHVIFKSNNGSNSPNNLITLCESCHKQLHCGEFTISGSKSKTKYATEVGIVTSQLKKRFGEFEEVFGYDTKFKREQVLKLSKHHSHDAIAICCGEGEVVDYTPVVYFKKTVSKGDYQQTKGKRSEITIPTGKLFGFRKFDLIKTPKGIGRVKGKRSTGYFSIEGLHPIDVDVRKLCTRISARDTVLVTRSKHLSPS